MKRNLNFQKILAPDWNNIRQILEQIISCDSPGEAVFNFTKIKYN